jgi:hypothetical protein
MLVKPLRIITETYTDEHGDKEEYRVAVFNFESASKIRRAYEDFKDTNSDVYKTCQQIANRLYPATEDFLDYCFGEMDDGHLIYSFDGIKGTNKNVTMRLYELFKSLEWVNHREQRAFSVTDCGAFFVFGNVCW